LSCAEVSRLARTIAQLRVSQVGQRARLRTQRFALEKQLPFARRWLLAGPDPLNGCGWPATFMPFDERLWRSQPGMPDPSNGEITLLGVRRTVAPVGKDGMPDWSAAHWQMSGESLLWRFHLYYWDWAWPLIGAPEGREVQLVFAAIWKSWHSAVPAGRGTAWHPYPVALRAWSFCGLYGHLVKDSSIEASFRSDLAMHAGFLMRNIETDVGGNHLIKNLKALIGLAVFFPDERLLDRTLGRLRRQLAIQVLPDGGHYERAPAYHCQVLSDLIDISDLLRAAGHDEPADLGEAIGAMRGWLGAVLTPRGEIPLINDGFPVDKRLLSELMPAAPPAEPLRVLPATGLVRATAGDWHVLADIGLPCPRELPAHAHADTFSFQVHVDGAPLLIDTGTSSYAPGAVRDRERSTAAHSTVEVDGQDSTEVWGTFRAGLRARVTGACFSVRAETVTFAAVHDGYRHLPGGPRHRRLWALNPRELRVEDTVTGRGRHRITVRWHLAPDTQLGLTPRGAVVDTKSGEFTVTIAAPSGTAVTSATAQAAVGFGRTVPVPVLVCDLHSELPVRISTVWRRADS
jgi:uncharacterized heparinase superfamily protein